ncbi:MAG: hypothetical protein FWC91_14455 [Defluviitaleaceae bacterium]|nr:hypothetical protein [Defluviitaleaceae bacterium]
MSSITFISFPKKIEIYRLSDILNKEIKFNINYVADIFREEILRYSESPVRVNNVSVTEREEASFDNCFKNSFIYDLRISRSKYKYDEKIKILMGNKKKRIKRRKLKRIRDKERLFRDQLLYTFLQLTLNVDEFVEIYSDWIYGENYNFGPPKSEDVIDLEELLIFPKPERILEKHKLTIYKTKQRDLPLL